MKLFFVLGVLLLPFLAKGQLQWFRIFDPDAEVARNPDGVPPPLNRHAFGYYGGTNSLILFGGETGGAANGETWLFSIAHGNWTRVNTAVSPPARVDSVFGVIESLRIFVVAFGSDLTLGVNFEDVWAFNFNTMTWSQIAPGGSGPTKRYGVFGGVPFGTGTEFWVGGGFTQVTDNAAVYRANIDIYKLTFTDATSAQWTQLTANPSEGNQYNPFVPHGRAYAASALVTADRLVIYGGCLSGGTGGGPCPSEDSWLFDEKTRAWTSLATCPSPRSSAAMAPLSSSNERAILLGGSENLRQVISVEEYPPNEIYVLDINAAVDRQWTRVQAIGFQGEFPGRRSDHAMAAAADGTVFLFGGRLRSGENRRDLWKLNGTVEGSATFSSQCSRTWFSYAHLHGLLMGLPWGILLPLGFFIARYYRTKGPLWFILHIILQVLSVALVVTSFIIIFSTTANPVPLYPHGLIGILLMALLLMQLLSGILRPRAKRNHKKKSPYRVCWEYSHRVSGIFMIIVGFLNITLGLFLVIAPLILWAIWIAVLGLWILAFVIHESVKWVIYCNRRRKLPKGQKMEMEMKTY